MKRYLIIILALCAIGARAQVNANQQPFKTIYGDMQFNTPFYDQEDHWVVAGKNPKNNKYVFGMIYLDNTAGFTFRAEGLFGVDAQGHVFRDSSDYIKNGILTTRITNSTNLICAIPDAMLADLKVQPVPDWLAVYHPATLDRNSNAYKIAHGRFLNSVKVPAKALQYLEPVYKTDPHATGLEYELSYAYNLLGRNAEAQAVLKSAIANAPDNSSLYAELGYAYIQGKDNDKAVDIFLKGLALAKQKNDNFFRSAMTTNLVLLYNELKQYDKAIATINQLLADAPPAPNWYILMATTYLKSNDNESAAKSYAKGIEVSNPADMQGKAQLAYTVAILYRDKLSNTQQYTYWGQKAKEWAPVNTPVAKAANTLVF